MLFAQANVNGQAETTAEAAVPPSQALHYTNKTGGVRDGLDIYCNQTLDAVQVNPPGVPTPFTMSIGINNGTGVRLWAPPVNKVANGGRVPEENEMTLVGVNNSPKPMRVQCAQWTLNQGGNQVAQNAVMRLICLNRTDAAQAADELNIQVGAWTNPPPGVPKQFVPYKLKDTDDGALADNDKKVVINNLNVANGGQHGPVQLTLDVAGCAPVTECVWKRLGQPQGKVAAALLVNNTTLPADKLIVRTNLPITNIEPSNIAPFASVSGLGSTTLVFSGADPMIEPGEGMYDDMLHLTTNDTTSTDLEVESIVWTDSAVPTVSAWGIVAMTLLVVAAATVVLMQRRKSTVGD